MIVHCERLVNRIIAGLLFTPLLIIGCAEPDNPVGSGVAPEIGGQLHNASYYAVWDSSFTAPFVRTSAGPYLYVGKAEGMTCEAVIKFDRPYDRDSITIDSGWVNLYWKGGIGSGATPALKASLFDYRWDETSSLTADSIPAGADLEQIGATPADSGIVTWAVPVDSLRRWFAWIDSSALDTDWVSPRADSSLSIHIQAQNAVDRIISFQSREATVDSLWMLPVLHLKLTRIDTSGASVPDSLSLYTGGDMFIVHNDSTDPGDRLIVGRGASYRSFLKFDYSALRTVGKTVPVVINRAYLTLHRDTTRFPWANVTPSISAGFLLDDRWLTNPDSLYASFAKSAGVDAAGDSVQLDVTSQLFNLYMKDDHGIIIRGDFEGYMIDRTAFFTTAADSAHKPRLTIYYTEFSQ